MDMRTVFWFLEGEDKSVYLFKQFTEGRVLLVFGGFPGGLVEIHGTESSLEALANKILVLLRDLREEAHDET